MANGKLKMGGKWSVGHNAQANLIVLKFEWSENDKVELGCPPDVAEAFVSAILENVTELKKTHQETKRPVQ